MQRLCFIRAIFSSLIHADRVSCPYNPTLPICHLSPLIQPQPLPSGLSSPLPCHAYMCACVRACVRACMRMTQLLPLLQSTRVTLKMDVSHTEHSHVIGKGGNNIKQVMQDTGCHIHFPDSNRNNQLEKSNQVWNNLFISLCLSLYINLSLSLYLTSQSFTLYVSVSLYKSIPFSISHISIFHSLCLCFFI